MTTEKEIKYDTLITNLFSENKITQEEYNIVQDYINELNGQIDDLEYDLDNLEGEYSDLESENEDLQNEIDQRDDDKKLKIVDLIQEIVDDQWKYVHPTYTTKEKILDRLDYILRYEV